MQERVPVQPETNQAFTEVAQKSRLNWHMVNSTADPLPGSYFAQVNELYPFEKVSDRARSYVDAALQHMMMWADFHAPLKFHPEQTVTITMRPTMALARSALEAAAQAVWLMDTRDPVECVRRHLQLIRWDLEEHRKSRQEQRHKDRVRARDLDLLERVESVFTAEEIKPPTGYLWVIQQACKPEDLDLQVDQVERVWRAASGATHGMYWVNLALTDVAIGEEHEKGQFRSMTVPSAEPLMEVLQTAVSMTQYAALKFLLFTGADIPTLSSSAAQWLAASITPNDSESEVLKQLKAGDPTQPNAHET